MTSPIWLDAAGRHAGLLDVWPRGGARIRGVRAAEIEIPQSLLPAWVRPMTIEGPGL